MKLKWWIYMFVWIIHIFVWNWWEFIPLYEPWTWPCPARSGHPRCLQEESCPTSSLSGRSCTETINTWQSRMKERATDDWNRKYPGLEISGTGNSRDWKFPGLKVPGTENSQDRKSPGLEISGLESPETKNPETGIPRNWRHKNQLVTGFHRK